MTASKLIRYDEDSPRLLQQKAAYDNNEQFECGIEEVTNLFALLEQTSRVNCARIAKLTGLGPYAVSNRYKRWHQEIGKTLSGPKFYREFLSRFIARQERLIDKMEDKGQLSQASQASILMIATLARMGAFATAEESDFSKEKLVPAMTKEQATKLLEEANRARESLPEISEVDTFDEQAARRALCSISDEDLEGYQDGLEE